MCIPICFCVINNGVFYFSHRIEFSAETMFVACVKNLLINLLVKANINIARQWESNDLYRAVIGYLYTAIGGLLHMESAMDIHTFTCK